MTHELRTPLTTFRLYTEMLDEGMVVDPAAQRQYVKTLRAEADRLGHLVENVLAYARLERGRLGRRRRGRRARDSVRPPGPSACPRARQAGVELVVDSVDVDATVRVNVSIVDQILSNLVDNALKYAGKADDRRIHLDAVPAGRWLN